jgi:drug/metabolite transporter (DMT)-like permease
VSGLALFYLALSRGTMGLVAPLTALIGATVPALVGVARGDRIAPIVLAGMLLALASVVVISLPDRRLGTPVLPAYRGARLGEWLLILGAGLGFAAFFLGIDRAHEAGGGTWWPLFAVRVAGVLLVTLAVIGLAVRGRRPSLRFGGAILPLGALAAIGDTGGNLFFVLASGAGELGVTVVLSSLYPVGTALLARIFLNERLSPMRLAGVALALVAVSLISLGQVFAP